MTIADTDVLIDTMLGREPAATRVRAGLRDGTLATTSITAFELRSGSRTERERHAVEAMLEALSVLPFDGAASAQAAASRRDLELAGRTVGMGDYLIVGICLSRSATLLTRNGKHFDRIPNLVVIDP